MTATAPATISMELRPAAQSVPVGEIVRIELYLVSDDPELPESFAAAETVFTWNPDDLELLGIDNTGATALLISNLPANDAFGLNEADPPADGNGLYQALAFLGFPGEATSAGTLVTTLEFRTLQEVTNTPVTIEEILQIEENPPGRSRVFSGTVPGLEVTGELRGAVVTVGDVTCPWDINGDNAVGFTDLIAVLASWGACPGCPEDIDGDGAVGFADLVAILSHWGPCP